MNKLKNLTGKRFGQWEVISQVISKGARNTTWNCKCDCGTISKIRGTALLTGKSIRCKNCALLHLKHGNLKDNFHVAAGTVFQQVKYNAKTRKLICTLTKEDIKKFMVQNCHYCGALPSNAVSIFGGKVAYHRTIFYSGIDRVDNTKGYILNNCVPCCQQCNWAKSDLTVDQFAGWIKTVYLNTKNRITDKTVGVLIDQLGTTLLKCWFAQEKVMQATTSEEKALAGQLAQETNARRNELIRSIDKFFGNSETELPKTYA
jgi:hypothetical protein